MKTLVVGYNAIQAKAVANLSDIFNSTNCSLVYKADGGYESWAPGRDVNAFTALEVDKGYIAVMKTTLDVSDYFYPASGGTFWGVMTFVNPVAGNELDLVANSGGVFSTLYTEDAAAPAYRTFTKDYLDTHLGSPITSIGMVASVGQNGTYRITTIKRVDGDQVVETHDSETGEVNYFPDTWNVSDLEGGDVTVFIKKIA